ALREGVAEVGPAQVLGDRLEPVVLGHANEGPATGTLPGPLTARSEPTVALPRRREPLPLARLVLAALVRSCCGDAVPHHEEQDDGQHDEPPRTALRLGDHDR